MRPCTTKASKERRKDVDLRFKAPAMMAYLVIPISFLSAFEVC